MELLDSLRRQCSRREYCTADILAKIRKSSCPEKADEIIASLEAEGYLSDRRYAEAFARDKSSLDGWGPVKIRFMLSGKGISKSDIDAALGEIDAEAALKRLKSLAAAKYSVLKDDPQCKLKLIKYLLGRGYEYEAVNKVLNDSCFQGDCGSSPQ